MHPSVSDDEMTGTQLEDDDVETLSYLDILLGSDHWNVDVEDPKEDAKE